MQLVYSVLILVSSLSAAEEMTKTFQCGRYTQPTRQILKPLSCDDTAGFFLVGEANHLRPELRSIFKGVTDESLNASTDAKLRDQALEAKFRLTSNMNGAEFTFPSGVKREVFRGSYLAPQFTQSSILKRLSSESDRNKACMRSLISEHHLQKVVNYDELDWDSAKRLTTEEKKEFLESNPKGSYWMFNEHSDRTFQYKFSKGKGSNLEEKKKDVMNQVATIIREIEGDPKVPGNVYIHCYGGHHRTGVVFGVMQKCFGQMPVEDVINEYKCHIGYESTEKPGGFHSDNETLIREFPCDQYFKKLKS